MYLNVGLSNQKELLYWTKQLHSSYWERWSFRYVGTRSWRQLQISTISLYWAWKPIGNQCKCCKIGIIYSLLSSLIIDGLLHFAPTEVSSSSSIAAPHRVYYNSQALKLTLPGSGWQTESLQTKCNGQNGLLDSVEPVSQITELCPAGCQNSSWCLLKCWMLSDVERNISSSLGVLLTSITSVFSGFSLFSPSHLYPPNSNKKIRAPQSYASILDIWT